MTAAPLRPSMPGNAPRVARLWSVLVWVWGGCLLVALPACERDAGDPGSAESRPSSESSLGSSLPEAGPASGTASPGSVARSVMVERLIVESIERESPWAIAHLLLVLPTGDGSEPDSVRWDGQSPVERLRTRWLKRDDTTGRVFFQLNRSVTLGEQHPHLVLKNLAETGRGAALVEELVASACAGFTRPKTWEEWNDCAWLLEGLAWRTLPPPSLGSDDDSMTVPELARGLLEVFESADQIVDRELAKGPGFQRPSGDGDPSASGTYAYTCGGLHLLQALLKAAERGWLDEAQRARLGVRVQAFFRRFDLEYEFREREAARAVAQGAEPTVARRMQHMFCLKLLGHGLEIAARARRVELGIPVRRQREIDRAVAEGRERLLALLVDLTTQIDAQGHLLPSLRKRKHPFWEFWFGDGCHALRGLKLTD